MDFLVERPPREVLNKVGVYLFRRGFGMPEGGRTDTSMLFTRSHAQHKGLLRRRLGALGTTSVSRQKVRVVTSEVGEGSTRLTVIASSQGKGPDIQAEIEQWIIEELGATYYWPS
jgi:hypothetical protein